MLLRSAALALILGGCSVDGARADLPAEPEPTPGATDPAAVGAAPDGAVVKPVTIPGGRACTQIGCLDGLRIDLGGKTGQKGTYAITATADGKQSACTLTLPLPPCSDAGATKCTGDLGLRVGEVGCALPADQHAIGPLSLKGAPAEIALTITRDGQPAAKETLRPTYKTVQPNGPECGPTCNQGEAKLELK